MFLLKKDAVTIDPGEPFLFTTSITSNNASSNASNDFKDFPSLPREWF
jgi:hypothetical protein